jgi:hypothetical protein
MTRSRRGAIRPSIFHIEGNCGTYGGKADATTEKCFGWEILIVLLRITGIELSEKVLRLVPSHQQRRDDVEKENLTLKEEDKRFGWTDSTI